MFSGRAISCEACVYMIGISKNRKPEKEVQHGVLASMTGEKSISDGR